MKVIKLNSAFHYIKYANSYGMKQDNGFEMRKKKKRRAYFNGAEIHSRVNTKHAAYAAVASIDVGESLGILFLFWWMCGKK